MFLNGGLKHRLRLHIGLKRAEEKLTGSTNVYRKHGTGSLPACQKGFGGGECFMHLRMEEAECQALVYVLPREEGRREILKMAGTSDCKTLKTSLTTS